MVRMAQDPSIVDLFDEGSGADRSIPVQERLIDEGDALQGRTVGDVSGVVLALRRSDGSVMARPESSTTLQANDVMLLLATD